MNCLNIGVGGRGTGGWTTLDADPANSPDIVASIPPLPEPVKKTSWDRIEMIQFIEHLCPWEADEVLKEVHSVLRPGGLVVLEQPNIEYCARVLLGLETPPPGRAGQFDMWGLYGGPTCRKPLMMHRWGYTPKSLAEALVRAGFERDKIAPKPAVHHFPVRDFRIEAVK